VASCAEMNNTMTQAVVSIAVHFLQPWNYWESGRRDRERAVRFLALIRRTPPTWANHIDLKKPSFMGLGSKVVLAKHLSRPFN